MPLKKILEKELSFLIHKGILEDLTAKFNLNLAFVEHFIVYIVLSLKSSEYIG